MAAKVHCESSRQLGFALSLPLPSLLPSNGGRKTVFMVTSNVYFDWTIAVSCVLSGFDVSVNKNSQYIEHMHLINKNKFVADVEAPICFGTEVPSSGSYRTKNYKPNM
jgi:hypothetical protein